MMHDFAKTEIHTGETSIFARSHGSGPPILLLHGFPQTHLMWRSVAPLLARDSAVVCADLRGYGCSGCPPSAPEHAPFSKRAMAQDMVMERLGFERYSVAGHDRGELALYRPITSTGSPSSTSKSPERRTSRAQATECPSGALPRPYRSSGAAPRRPKERIARGSRH